MTPAIVTEPKATYEIVRPKGDNECFTVYIRNGRWVTSACLTFHKATRTDMASVLRRIADELDPMGS